MAESDWPKEPWVLDVNRIEGREFLKLHKDDRRLARALGMDMNEWSPWAGPGETFLSLTT